MEAPSGAFGGAQTADAPAPLGRAVSSANDVAEIRPHPKRLGLYAAAFESAAEHGGTGRGGAPEPTAVHPCVHCRNRAVAVQGGGAPAAGGGAGDDRAKSPQLGNDSAGGGVSGSVAYARGIHARVWCAAAGKRPEPLVKTPAPN